MSASAHVAIIGSGPAAFYAAEQVLKLGGNVAMFERLPTPFGLVRGGVAPDHPKIKSVTKVYERIASHANFRWYGHVEFGRDVLQEDLPGLFHAVIFATGAQTDRRMGIPGEDLAGSHPATEFVAWYNGHPDYQHHHFDLSVRAAAVVGNGNVAMDVARILARTPEELAETDIADNALEALRHSQIETIYVLGRRGPAQAAYTTPEIKELGELSDADVIVLPEESALDPLSAAALSASPDRGTQGNVDTIARYAAQGPQGKRRHVVMRFLVSPVRLIGETHVEAIELVRNELVAAPDGSLRARATDKTEVLPVGLVFRSIGYKGVSLPGVPFDDGRGVIPNASGRVLDADGHPVTGEYAAGWIKRGPSGIIGTNKPDSIETANALMEDVAAGRCWQPSQPGPASVEALLTSRGIDWMSFEEWQALDAEETARGQVSGRPRVKYTDVDTMMHTVHDRRDSTGQQH